MSKAACIYIYIHYIHTYISFYTFVLPWYDRGWLGVYRSNIDLSRSLGMSVGYQLYYRVIFRGQILQWKFACVCSISDLKNAIENTCFTMKSTIEWRQFQWFDKSIIQFNCIDYAVCVCNVMMWLTRSNSQLLKKRPIRRPFLTFCCNLTVGRIRWV